MGSLGMGIERTERKSFQLFLFSFFTLLSSIYGLGPPFGGTPFLKFKDVPPVLVTSRSSGSLSLTCSVTGSPTPSVGWYRNGVLLAGAEGGGSGLGETWAALHLSCISES